MDLEKFLPFTSGEPRLFDIIIYNAACNMKCKYCFGEHSQNIRNSCATQLNAKKLDKALESVPKNRTGQVTIWGGEPLFNKTQLIDTVSYIKDRFPNAEINMMINGSLLNDYWTRYLIDNKIFIGISHDGPGQKYRGFDFLESDSIKNNIVLLRKYNLFNSFNSLFHKQSPLVKDIHEYFKKKEDEMGVKLGTSPRLIRYINSASIPYLFGPEDYHFLDDNAEYIVKFYMRSLLNNDSISIDKMLGRPIKEAITYTLAKITNRPFPFIKDMPYCGTTSYPKVTIEGDRVFCNGVTERGDLAEAKRLLTNYKSWNKCISCEYNSICHGICAALTHEQLEKNCNMYKYFYSKLEEQLLYFMEAR